MNLLTKIFFNVALIMQQSLFCMSNSTDKQLQEQLFPLKDFDIILFTNNHGPLKITSNVNEDFLLNTNQELHQDLHQSVTNQ